jgi:hypothetical protein
VEGWECVAWPNPVSLVTNGAMNPWEANIPDPSFRILVEHVRNTPETEVCGQEAVIVLVSEDVDVGLHGSDHVRIFRGRYCSKEHVRLSPVVDENVLFGEEAKVEFVFPTECKDVRISGPTGLVDGYCGVKPRHCEF